MRIRIGLVLIVISCGVAAGQLHPFTPEDLLSMSRIGQIAVSPDGNRIVFEVAQVDMEADGLKKDIWLVEKDGRNLRALTTHPEDDIDPVWSPDGRYIWFLAKRSGLWQVWRITADGGEAVQITDLPLDLANLRISPDGTLIAFTCRVFPDSNGIAQTAERLRSASNRKATGRIYDRLFVRHWDTWSDGRRSHIFVMPCKGGEPVDLMRGMDADCPSVPFGGIEEFTFSPDGRSIVFSTKLAGRAEAWSTDFDLFVVPTDGSSPPRPLTKDNPAWDSYPCFCPDGKRLAYLAMARPGYESDRFRIVIQDWPGGRRRVLTGSWDRSPSSITWSSDGTEIYAIAPHIGQVGLFAVDANTGLVRTIIANGSVEQMAVSGDRIFFRLSTFTSPSELYSIRADGADLRRITGINLDRLAKIRMGHFEQFSFEGSAGDTVYGYVVAPVDLDPNSRYPIAMLIHGGPQGSFANNFHYRWNPQIYAGAGYGVLMIDFHGSTGYGQAFTDSVRGNWGSRPLEDLQIGLAVAIQRYHWLDGQRVGALGASYGGYMVNWIAGNWPDRFKCLVSHAGSLDERIGYLETDELWFPDWEYSGQPWTNPEAYERCNPIRYAGNFRTPMLVIHGALDYRVPDTQGISTFALLQRLGVPSRLLYFPDEGHWVLRPHNCLLWHRTVLDWLDRYLKGFEAAD